MAAELVFASEAEQDITEACSWYEGRRPGLGEEFPGCVEACIEVSGARPRCTQPSYSTVPTIAFTRSNALRSAAVGPSVDGPALFIDRNPLYPLSLRIRKQPA